MAKKSLDEVYEKYWKKIVEHGGGKYVGIQETGGDDDLVLFNSLKSGSTLAIKTSVCTADAVAVKLALHEDKYDAINVRRSC